MDHLFRLLHKGKKQQKENNILGIIDSLSPSLSLHPPLPIHVSPPCKIPLTKFPSHFYPILPSKTPDQTYNCKYLEHPHSKAGYKEPQKERKATNISHFNPLTLYHHLQAPPSANTPPAENHDLYCTVTTPATQTIPLKSPPTIKLEN